MEIKEDIENSKVFIDDIVIDGFIDDEVCQYCGMKRIYYDNYDTHFCPRCNKWLESICNDEFCEYCSQRPIKPLNLKP